MPRNTNAGWEGHIVSPRKFGVEIELTRVNSDRLRSILGRYSVLYRDSDGNQSGSAPSSWVLKFDASVSGDGRELVSPPLSGILGMGELKLVLSAVLSSSGEVDESCGLHVHHDARDLQENHLKALLIMFFKYSKLIYGVADSGRARNRYCQQWTRSEVEEALSKTGPEFYNFIQRDRYKGLNFCSLRSHGTVEFRLMEGTLDERKIESWVAMTQRLVRVARYGRMPSLGTVGSQFQLLGSVTKMLPRNGNNPSKAEQSAFNYLSSEYYSRNPRVGTGKGRAGEIGE